MNFTVYRSSAGSGKTTQLVSEFVKLVVSDVSKYRSVLAITFTNKAANEMKERILQALTRLAKPEQFKDSFEIEVLLPKLVKECTLDQDEISRRALIVFRSILHHYSEFGVGTIDSFVHRIIRTFAHDLHLNMDFTVELDTDKLINEAVGVLLSRVGVDIDTTRVLIEFVRESAREGDNWNIEDSILNVASLLTKESKSEPLNALRDIQAADWLDIRKAFLGENRKFVESMRKPALKALELIERNGIEIQSLHRGKTGFWSFLNKMRNQEKEDIGLKSNFCKTLDEDKWASGKADTDQKARIESVRNELRLLLEKIRTINENGLKKYNSRKAVLKNLFPLAVLNELSIIFNEMSRENNILPISDFNKRISGIIQEQPVPFIYERAGEKYSHYLIDEFQDTSILQWQNLLPLLDNSLAHGNFNMIVGDGKQSIYRWRGGEVEQFNKLPAVFKKELNEWNDEREESLLRNFREEVLDFNFRSAPAVINFNNELFEILSSFLPEDHRDIYRDQRQKGVDKPIDGFVSLSFIESENRDTYRHIVAKRTAELIRAALDDGYEFGDIAILCRFNNNATYIAEYLSELQEPIPVVSPDSLSIESSPAVQLLLSFMRLNEKRDDAVSAALIIKLLHELGRINQELDAYLLDLPKARNADYKQAISSFIAKHAFDDPFSKLDRLNLFDASEFIIRTFIVEEDNKLNAYVQFFLDHVLKFESEENAGILKFLDWWDSLGTPKLELPEGRNAVKLMTVHKSKGLQFPVVICPFLLTEKGNKTEFLWGANKEDHSDILPFVLLRSVKGLVETDYEPVLKEELEKHLLDKMNVFYVMTTRAEDRLYLFSEQLKKPTKIDSLPAFLIAYLQAKDIPITNEPVNFGNEEPNFRSAKESGEEIQLSSFSADWKEKVSLSFQAPELWDLDSGNDAQEWGLQLHYALSFLETADDLPDVIHRCKEEGSIEAEKLLVLEKLIGEIIENPVLKFFFDNEASVFNEKDILDSEGQIHRPDRIVTHGKDARILDYKTGKEKDSYKDQLLRYAGLLEEMGYSIKQLVLLYLGEEQKIVEVSY